MNDTDRPKRPSYERRISPSDLKRAQRALKKAIRKAERRRTRLVELQKQNDRLSGELRSLREFDPTKVGY